MKALIDSKTCTKCDRVLPLSEYRERSSNKGLFQSWCKVCSKKENTLRQRARLRARKEEAVEKFGNKCSDCNKSYHQSIYEFHHIDPSTKILDPSKALNRGNWDELDKCVMLCANCHRLRHWIEESE